MVSRKVEQKIFSAILIILLVTAFIHFFAMRARANQLRRRQQAAGTAVVTLHDFNDIELDARSTRADMPSAVRHGLAGAKVRVMREGAMGLDMCLALNLQSPTQSNRLQLLPAELLLIIIEYLDYGSVLSLSRTNRFFRDTSPADYLVEEDKLDYVLAAEGWKHNRNRLACFLCMKVRGKKHFDKRNQSIFLKKYGESELARRCKECGKHMQELRLEGTSARLGAQV